MVTVRMLCAMMFMGGVVIVVDGCKSIFMIAVDESGVCGENGVCYESLYSDFACSIVSDVVIVLA